MSTEILSCDVDWRNPARNKRNLNAVTPVKTQGKCGSCWAFAALAQLESTVLLNGGTALDLSEQQMLNCNPDHWSCNGGWAVAAWDWAITNGGVSAESQVPYVATTTTYGPWIDAIRFPGVGTCTKTAKAFGTNIKGWNQVAPPNDAGLAAALQKRPVKIGLWANVGVWQNYVGGIITCTDAESTGLQRIGPSMMNHEIQAVGATTIPNSNGTMTPVYIVKNSWGSEWGPYGGFAYIERKAPADAPAGNCGVASDAQWLV